MKDRAKGKTRTDSPQPALVSLRCLLSLTPKKRHEQDHGGSLTGHDKHRNQRNPSLPRVGTATPVQLKSTESDDRFQLAWRARYFAEIHRHLAAV